MKLRLICFALAVCVLIPAAALAQEDAALSRIQLLNQKAMDEYDSLEFEAARNLLLEAVEAAQQAKIGQSPALVDTYLNLGIVYGAGLNDRINAIRAFTEALRIDRQALLSPTRATPILEEMYTAAKENLPPEPPPPPPDPGFSHQAVDEAAAGKPLAVQAQVKPELNAAQVLLHYKGATANTYEKLPMQQVGEGSYQATIPAAATRGRSLYYYIEVLNSAGQRLIGHGSDISPTIVALKGQSSQGKGGDQEEPPSGKVISLIAMGGTGLGIVYGGESEHEQLHQGNQTAQVNIMPGGAWAPFHIAPELSYHLTERWHLSAMGRIQVVNATSTKSKVSILALARAKRFFGSGSLRWFVAFGAGGGNIRHRIELGDYDKEIHAQNPPDTTPNDIVDTRVAGVGAFGAGGGFHYMFTPSVGVALDLNGLILVPDFAANLDLNTGLVFSF